MLVQGPMGSSLKATPELLCSLYQTQTLLSPSPQKHPTEYSSIGRQFKNHLLKGHARDWDVNPLVGHLATMHRDLGSVSNTTNMGYSGTHL